MDSWRCYANDSSDFRVTEASFDQLYDFWPGWNGYMSICKALLNRLLRAIEARRDLIKGTALASQLLSQSGINLNEPVF